VGAAANAIVDLRGPTQTPCAPIAAPAADAFALDAAFGYCQFADERASGCYGKREARMEIALMISMTVNGERHDVDVPPDTPLLWVIRDELGMTGTKFGCGAAQCGCCTVHIDGEATRSCVVPVSTIVGKQIHTIESLSTDNSHPVQKAWIAEQVPQCGYCQSGQIMAATALLAKTPKPTDSEIEQAMTNICRCGTYDRIRSAIHRAAGQVSS